MNFSTLPEDIQVLIFGNLSPYDLLKLRPVCKQFRTTTLLRPVWLELYYRYVFQSRIPAPGFEDFPLDSLDASDLERKVINTLELRRNWTSQEPAPAWRRDFSAHEPPESRRIISLRFISKSLLLSVAIQTRIVQNGRNYSFKIWDIDKAPVSCVYALQVDDIRGWAINSSLKYTAGLLAWHSGSEIQTLRLQNAHDSSGIRITPGMTVATSSSRVLAFYRSMVLTASDDDTLSLWFLDNPTKVFTLQSASSTQQQFLDVLWRDDFILVARATTIELFSLNQAQSGATSIVLFPAEKHVFQWSIDSIGLSITPTEPFSSQMAVNILIRFSTQYPWPLNMLHHYALRANTIFDSTTITNSYNLPLKFPPQLVETIGSPIRLLSPYSMALGEYGTALWIDTHTEDYFHHSYNGQRLAAKPLTRTPEDSGDHPQMTGEATSVFGVREVDGWVKVAIDDGQGLVATASDSGDITIMGYALV